MNMQISPEYLKFFYLHPPWTLSPFRLFPHYALGLGGFFISNRSRPHRLFTC